MYVSYDFEGGGREGLRGGVSVKKKTELKEVWESVFVVLEKEFRRG